MKGELKFPTLVGLIVAFGGLAAGLWLIGGQIRSRSEAAVMSAPQEVIVSDISDGGFTVSWITDQASIGYVLYGETTGDLANNVNDNRDRESGKTTAYFTHIVTVDGLKPETVYRFRLGSAGQGYGLGNEPYQTATGPVLAGRPAADVAYGQVVTAAGEPAEGALVYLQLPGGDKQATITQTDGSWAIPLSAARKADLTDYLKYDIQNADLTITAEAGVMGRGGIKVKTGQDSPAKEIVLQPATTADRTVYQDNTEVAGGDGESKIKSKLEMYTPAIREKINSGKPVIIGTAPPGTEIQITINSKSEITGKVVAGDDGSFEYPVSNTLEPGEHTITVSATIDGVVQQITRTFTVYAAGESLDPVFTATPSATTPTPLVQPVVSPTLAVKTTPVPTLKPTVVPTATPTRTPTPAPSPTPTAGVRVSPTPTPIIKTTPTPTTATKPSPTPPLELEGSGSTDWSVGLVLAGAGLWLVGGLWLKKIW